MLSPYSLAVPTKGYLHQCLRSKLVTLSFQVQVPCGLIRTYTLSNLLLYPCDNMMKNMDTFHANASLTFETPHFNLSQ